MSDTVKIEWQGRTYVGTLMSMESEIRSLPIAGRNAVSYAEQRMVSVTVMIDMRPPVVGSIGFVGEGGVYPGTTMLTVRGDPIPTDEVERWAWCFEDWPTDSYSALGLLAHRMPGFE